MKWFVLILIIIVLLIVFALWRRMQVRSEEASSARTSPPQIPRGPAIRPTPAESTLATEAGVDEVTAAPVSEQPVTGQPPPARPEGATDWWQDPEKDRPQP